jgi:tRNA A37 threonylcarbamoyladenosine biosynthesis protein TsaE
MRKQINKYDSPIDALISVTKRLSIFEDRYRMATEDFFNKFSKGQMEDSIDFIEWSNDYQHYLPIRLEIERKIQHVA